MSDMTVGAIDTTQVQPKKMSNAKKGAIIAAGAGVSVAALSSFKNKQLYTDLFQNTTKALGKNKGTAVYAAGIAIGTTIGTAIWAGIGAGIGKIVDAVKSKNS